MTNSNEDKMSHIKDYTRFRELQLTLRFKSVSQNITLRLYVGLYYSDNNGW